MTAKVDVPPADPRRKRGRRHLLAGLLAVGIAAVTAGSRSFAAIGQWAADAGPDVLAGLGAARTGAAWTLRTAAAAAPGTKLATWGRAHLDKTRRAHGCSRAECKKCKFAESLTGDPNVSNFTVKTKACTKA
jgi:DDE_Tnp_1-associated